MDDLFKEGAVKEVVKKEVKEKKEGGKEGCS